ncbi:MAG: selenium metabolism-associated LysR family transcriptional regulator [Terrisporobacter sp.]|uniref:selenium metabolism-associated LysR family transcriptional regulator n=1 Tax=Terrisporobacter sp. TaxID=1965305 RepID=UPI002FC7EFD6
MNLKQLESFSYIIETSSFSEAAKKLFLTQPTISSHISLLEKELSTQLLIRTTKDVTPTEEGKKLYTYAKQMLQLQNSILEEFQVENVNERNVITLGASTIPELYILPEILPKYLKKNKNEFKICQGDSLEIINQVLNKEVEIGLVGTQIETSNCIFEPFYKDKLVIITPVNEKYLQMKENGFHIKDLLKEPILMRKEGSGTRKEIKAFLNHMNISDGDLNVIATLNSIEAIKRSVMNNMGISIVSNLAVEDYVKENRVLAFDLAEENIYRNLYIVRNKEMYMSKQALKFIKFMREIYKEFAY